jgi:two-component system sensor histidine kinase UhpB
MMIERELWQILREAIVNAERHAHAGRIEVSGRRTDGALRLFVRDDGVGLDATHARHDSYGLVGMRERAHRLDAELSVCTPPKGGTEVRITLFTRGRQL